jgi:putative DNA primase/helicase
MRPNFFQIAEPLVKRGWAVFPLKGKEPLVQGGFKAATTDISIVRHWAGQYVGANIGIATGQASGIMVVDIDDAPGKTGMDNWVDFCRVNDLEPKTLVVKTGHGLHYYFKLPAGVELRNTASKLAKNIDTRADGGYVVGPGSIHPLTNEPYLILEDEPIAELPQAILEALTQAKPEKVELPSLPRAEINTSRYIAKVLESESSQIMAAHDGTRNHALNKAAYNLGRYVGGGYLSESDANDTLYRAAMAAGLGERETWKTINSGMSEGKTSPRVINSPKAQHVQVLKQNETPDPFVIQCCENGEMGDATLFAHMTRGQTLFDHTSDCWYYYSNGFWIKDYTGQVKRKLFDMLTNTYLNVSKRIDDQLVEYQRQADGEAEKKVKNLGFTRDQLRRRVRQLGKKSALDNVAGLAKIHNHVLATDFDKNPYKFNCLNGTYDFQTAQFGKHSPGDLLSKQSPVHFNPDADCPHWIMFLYKIFADEQGIPDVDLVRYVQKLVGYSLTGITDLQMLAFCFGTGANGKSTFFNVLRLLLGEFYQTIPIETLLSKYHSGTDEYHLAKLKGARVAVASEIPAGRRLQASLVKDLTSNDMLTARNPYERPINFMPTHKLWMFGNHKPEIPERDEGTWRRMHLIPFTRTIPENERRPMTDVMAEFTSELSGILNWAIEGYHALQTEGICIPDVVKDATKEYRSESDSFKSFCEECLCETTMSGIQIKKLFAAYKTWCDENGERPIFVNTRTMATFLRQTGKSVENGTGNAVYLIGYRLHEGVNS